MTETLDQKIERYAISAFLSNSSGRPSLRGIGTNGRPEARWISVLLKMRDALHRVTPARVRKHRITQREAEIQRASGLPFVPNPRREGLPEELDRKAEIAY